MRDSEEIYSLFEKVFDIDRNTENFSANYEIGDDFEISIGIYSGDVRIDARGGGLDYDFRTRPLGTNGSVRNHLSSRVAIEDGVYYLLYDPSRSDQERKGKKRNIYWENTVFVEGRNWYCIKIDNNLPGSIYAMLIFGGRLNPPPLPLGSRHSPSRRDGNLILIQAPAKMRM